MNSTASGERGIERSRSEYGETDPRTGTVCVVGLGYVGLPLAVEFDAAGFDVLGYDVDASTIGDLTDGVDTTGELGDEVIRESEVAFTADGSEIANADFVLVAVPTPVDENDVPSLEYVVGAAEVVGRHMTVGTTVVLESTVYPGATREELVPTLEATSGLECGEGFNVGYSPERASPGNGDRGLQDVVKIVSADGEETLDEVATLYDHVVDAGVFRAESIEVAEAAKVIENVQRDVNIALMNELAMVFDDLGIDTHAVIDAADSKWNFHGYRPGLVGGHCIPVDPHYLAYRAKRDGNTPELIKASRQINESVSDHVATQTIKALARRSKPLADSSVLVLGLTYKADVADMRRSMIPDVVEGIEEYGVDVGAFDPLAVDAEDRFDFPVEDTLSFEGYDGVILATPHQEFVEIPYRTVCEVLEEQPAIVDVEGALDPSTLPETAIYRRL